MLKLGLLKLFLYFESVLVHVSLELRVGNRLPLRLVQTSFLLVLVYGRRLVPLLFCLEVEVVQILVISHGGGGSLRHRLVVVAGAGFPDQPLLGRLILIESQSDATDSVFGQAVEHFCEARARLIKFYLGLLIHSNNLIK